MTPKRKMLVLEINEADRYFLEKYVNAGHLPSFKKLLTQGKLIETRISAWDATQEKAWRDISPWMVWPSIYTGLTPQQHGIVGFGQDPKILAGNCIWDKLHERGITTGVMSNLMSYPVRWNPSSLFYIPEALADTADCLPKKLEPIQDFLIYTARNYSESFLTNSLQATYKLIKSVKAGLPASIALQILAQVPLEIIKGSHFQQNRALLQAKLQMTLFKALYAAFQPDFATLHMNHIAYMQHRYWRAAEPDHFEDELSPLDGYYFGTIAKRKRHEIKLKDAILDAFKITDRFLATMLATLPAETALVVLSGLGQRKMDPNGEIHNPEMRIINLEKILSAVAVKNCKILTQMNPDLTLNFETENEASLAIQNINQILILGKFPLFRIQQVKHQLFLEGSLPKEIWSLGKNAWITIDGGQNKLPLFDFVRVSRAKDQSTAHHRDEGWMLVYGNDQPILDSIKKSTIDITEISPILTSYFN